MTGSERRRAVDLVDLVDLVASVELVVLAAASGRRPLAPEVEAFALAAVFSGLPGGTRGPVLLATDTQLGPDALGVRVQAVHWNRTSRRAMPARSRTGLPNAERIRLSRRSGKPPVNPPVNPRETIATPRIQHPQPTRW